MRFKNYILNEREYGEEIVDNFLSFVKKDCKPFLKDISSIKTFLYSGRKTTDDWFKDKVRKDRNPKDTPKEVHEYLDKKFKEYFGVKARSQSLFVTANQNEAREYGIPFIIFPIGKYKIIWSSKVEDLWYYLSSYRINSINTIKNNEEKVDKMLNSYYMGDLRGAIWSNNEIMLICDEYYAINQTFQPLLLKELQWD